MLLVSGSVNARASGGRIISQSTVETTPQHARTIHWLAPSGTVDRYKLEYKLTSDTLWNVIYLGADVLRYTVPRLHPEAYSIKVTAERAAGDTQVHTSTFDTPPATPNMFLSQKELQAIKAKVDAETQPFLTAYNQMIANADAALVTAPPSVTYQDDTSNQYYTVSPYVWPDPPYYRDGEINPDAARGDYDAAIALGDAVRDLGIAYQLTKNPIYAERAIEYLNVWFVDPVTRMLPNVQSDNSIDLYITLPGAFYGADLIMDYALWDATDKATFLSWCTTTLNDAMSVSLPPNNWANWQIVLIASLGHLLNNNTALQFAFTSYKDLVQSQIDDLGRFEHELDRTTSLAYSTYTINAMVHLAEIAWHNDEDLYSYVSADGGSLEKAFDFHAPYCLDPDSWPYQQIKTITADDNQSIWEVAAARFGKAPYIAARDHWSRPIKDVRVMGIVTLTHGVD